MIGYSSLLAMTQMFATEMKVGKELKKQELLERWEVMLTMPRKKKKQEKKHLLLMWDIMNWDPMGLDNFSLL